MSSPPAHEQAPEQENTIQSVEQTREQAREQREQELEQLRARQKPAHITIVVKNQNGHELEYKMNRKTPLGKLIKSYGEHTGQRGLRFIFEGTRISDGDSAEELDMENGDAIDVFQEQLGGGPSHPEAEPEVRTTDLKAKPSIVYGLISDRDDDNDRYWLPISFRVQVEAHEYIGDHDFCEIAISDEPRNHEESNKEIRYVKIITRKELQGQGGSRDYMLKIELVKGLFDLEGPVKGPGGWEGPKYQNLDKGNLRSHIVIGIQMFGGEIETIWFGISQNKPMETVMQAYLKGAGYFNHEVRFMFEGTRVNGLDTPNELEIVDGDVIEVFLAQTGGANNNTHPEPPLDAPLKASWTELDQALTGITKKPWALAPQLQHQVTDVIWKQKHWFGDPRKFPIVNTAQYADDFSGPANDINALVTLEAPVLTVNFRTALYTQLAILEDDFAAIYKHLYPDSEPITEWSFCQKPVHGDETPKTLGLGPRISDQNVMAVPYVLDDHRPRWGELGDSWELVLSAPRRRREADESETEDLEDDDDDDDDISDDEEPLTPDMDEKWYDDDQDESSAKRRRVSK